MNRYEFDPDVAAARVGSYRRRRARFRRGELFDIEDDGIVSRLSWEPLRPPSAGQRHAGRRA